LSKKIKQEKGDRVKSNALLEAALAYARQGWYVIPLHNPTEDGKCSCGKALDDHHRSGAKHPRISEWQDKATTDPGQIIAWWTQWPEANIGIVAGKSGLLVLDVDRDKGGFESLGNLFGEELDELPQTPTSETGGGGLHFVFAHPGGDVGNRTGIAPGLDIKADGGQFVAPPSLHSSGRKYEWIEGKGPEYPIAPVPQQLLDLLSKRAGENDGNGDKPILTESSLIPEGLRNDVIFRYALQLVTKGLNQQEIEVLALKKAEGCEQPPDHPYTEDELKNSVQSALD
jgi:Bifunctional DNA primase/polymerase, N-terminal